MVDIHQTDSSFRRLKIVILAVARQIGIRSRCNGLLPKLRSRAATHRHSSDGLLPGRMAYKGHSESLFHKRRKRSHIHPLRPFAYRAKAILRQRHELLYTHRLRYSATHTRLVQIGMRRIDGYAMPYSHRYTTLLRRRTRQVLQTMEKQRMMTQYQVKTTRHSITDNRFRYIDCQQRSPYVCRWITYLQPRIIPRLLTFPGGYTLYDIYNVLQ